MSNFWQGFEKQAKDNQVLVYRNIKKGPGYVYSLQSKDTGRVTGHDTDFFLKDVNFRVSGAGRDRVRSEGVKNVHAKVLGTRTDLDEAQYKWRAVTYNPKKNTGFVDRETGRPVTKADVAKMTGSGVLVGATLRSSSSPLRS